MRTHSIAACTLAAIVSGSGAHAQSTREVTVTPQSVVAIDAKVRFTTMIILPDGEEILDIICGDKDFWMVSGVQNFGYVKPAKAGATTNLNLVAKSGTVYSFLLKEGAANPDLKVFVVAGDGLPSTRARQRWYSAEDVEQLRLETEQVRRETEQVKRDSEAAGQRAEAAREAAVRAVEEEALRFRATYPTQLHFPYRFKAHANPFRVAAIYHDGRATYIRLAATELPAVYELKDRAPSLVNVQVQNGVLVIPKVVDRGYLAIGKQRLLFESRED